MVDSKENSKFDPGLKELTDSFPAIDVYWLQLTLSIPQVININFSLQYSYIIQQTGNENTQTRLVEVVVLI